MSRLTTEVTAFRLTKLYWEGRTSTSPFGARFKTASINRQGSRPQASKPGPHAWVGSRAEWRVPEGMPYSVRLNSKGDLLRPPAASSRHEIDSTRTHNSI